MKEVKEFEKLFKLNFPVIDNYQYYINTLSKSEEFEWVEKKLTDFNKYVEDVKQLGYEYSKSYKLDYAFSKMKKYIIDSKAYKNMQDTPLSNVFLRSKDELRNNDGELLLSIDFNAANFNTLKIFDKENELGDTWLDLCEKLNIHPVLAGSKSFRQYVFGNTNPGRLTKIQHSNILIIIDELLKSSLKEENLIFISHDEMIIKLNQDKTLASTQAVFFHNLVNSIIDKKAINMKTHKKVFSNTGIGKGMCIQTVYNVKLTGLSENYKTLFKVPGNKFFKMFKRYILCEPIEKRDLMFESDGEIAVWSEEDDSIVETIAPDGELTMSEIESDYPYLLNEIRSELPSLSSAQIRKLINIFLYTCNSCHNAASGCHCWNEE